MQTRFSLLLIISFLAQSGVHAQWNRKIYLGQHMDSLFSHDILHREMKDTMALCFSLGCSRVYFEQKDAPDQQEEVNRAGLILPAKSTHTETRNMRAVFAIGADSCEALYSGSRESVTHGRSAALSIFNLFAKSGDKIPQDDPVESENFFTISGVIHSDHLESPFRFTGDHRKDIYQPTGWIVVEGDTLKVWRVSEQQNKRGKIKHPHNILKLGFLLKRGDEIVAAVDDMPASPEMYISKSLDGEARLVVSSFLIMTEDN